MDRRQLRILTSLVIPDDPPTAAASRTPRPAAADAIWSPHDRAIADAVDLLTSDHAAERIRFVGIIGGASSGKSTLFNSITRAHAASRTGMIAHTTLGFVAAAPEPSHPEIIRLAATRRVLGCDRAEFISPSTGPRPVTGDPRLLTLVAAPQPAAPPRQLSRPVIVDTPDLTSLAARDEGDMTRRALPWFDAVIIVIDEDRWFDAQLFDWLASEINRLGTPRLVVFNRCQRDTPLTPQDHATLAAQAARFANPTRPTDAAALDPVVVLPHRPTVGPVTLADADIAPVTVWLNRLDRGDDHSRLPPLLRELSSRASAAIDRVDRLRAGIDRLEATLRAEVDAAARTNREIALHVLLDEQQRRRLSPVWHAVVRPFSSMTRRPADDARRAPQAPNAVPGDPHAGLTIRDRGISYFVHEADRLKTRLLVLATASDAWREARLNPDDRPWVDPDTDVLKHAEALSDRCQRAYERFSAVVEREFKSARLAAASSGGAVTGAVIGAIIAAAPGGFAAPLGAAIGAAIGGAASAWAATGLVGMARMLIRSPEHRNLWDAVRDYREEIERLAGLDVGRIVSVLDDAAGARDTTFIDALRAAADARDPRGITP